MSTEMKPLPLLDSPEVKNRPGQFDIYAAYDYVGYTPFCKGYEKAKQHNNQTSSTGPVPYRAVVN